MTGHDLMLEARLTVSDCRGDRPWRQDRFKWQNSQAQLLENATYLSACYRCGVSTRSRDNSLRTWGECGEHAHLMATHLPYLAQ